VNNQEKKIIFFPNLNGLRFIAALIVLISHVELIKSAMGLNNKYKLMEHLNLGGFGVYFFFVLSGFLITYLLLKEKYENKTISIKDFYVRRILRIWPLYYLIVIAGFFILPHIDVIKLNFYSDHFLKLFNENLILYLLILPNLAFSIFSAVPHIGQSWSIGVEEQFYLFWPLIIKKFKPTVKFILIVLFSILLLKILFFIIATNYSNYNLIVIFKKFIAMSKFESMIIGAFGALILFEKKEKLLLIFLNKKLFYFSVLCFIPLNYFLFYNVLQNGIHVIISFMFLVIILNLVYNPKYKTLLENKILNYLGSISYGIYMYHLMVIPFAIAVFKPINENSLLFNLLVYFFSIVISILISGLSFKFYESHFLRIKKKYEK